MKINSRRYIGCKTKLLEEIYNCVKEKKYNNTSIFADIFAGTGVVGSYFADKGFKVIFNDTLYSNYVAYQAFHGEGNIDNEKIISTINYFNEINSSDLDDNYFSKIYGNKYFAHPDSKKIGFIRDYIEKNKSDYSIREYYYLITALIYATDRIANTVGHYEAYLKKKTQFKHLLIEPLDINNNDVPAIIYNEDANKLSSSINCDIAYLDPPYNARQYVNFYHVLENLARWDKPTEFEGDSMKFKRNNLKSDYCRNKAPELLKDLVDNLNCKLIILSYSNTYDAKSISSINKISEKDLMSILSRKGKVERKEIDYKFFNSGKTNMKNHKEYLYICEVK